MTPATSPLTLTDVPKRRGKPPLHLADLDRVERRAVVVELGEPSYRAEQLSRHYFTRLVDDPADWTDVPAQARSSLAATRRSWRACSCVTDAEPTRAPPPSSARRPTTGTAPSA